MKYLILGLLLVGCASKPEARSARKVRYDVYNVCFDVSSRLLQKQGREALEEVAFVSNECEIESKKVSEKYR